jgi:NDP-sugar pyrophosphorylase family protein
MSTVLICPSERSTVPFFSKGLPLIGVPLLGQTLLEYWMSALAIRGVSKVLVLANENSERALEIVGRGERWGVEAEVVAESRELTPAEALLKYASEIDASAAAEAIVVLDHFPGMADQPLFDTYQDWFTALRLWMPFAMTIDRVGAHERRPGVWVGSHSHISLQAQLHAPCWIGQHVFIGEGANVGPGSVVEDGCFVEPRAELAECWVGPDTFVGQFARIKSSLAWGSTLLNWQTGSAAEVADQFLLCALRQPRRKRTLGWLGKLSDLYSRNKGEVNLLWKHLLLHKEG